MSPALFYWSLVTIEPVEYLFDHLVVWRNVSRFKHGVTFVFFRRPETFEHHILGGL